jgi:RNA polymerase sigma-70 factor (ECF subfamily)
LDEQALIAALKKGEAEAFGQLVGAYQHLVYNATLSMLQHDEDAEDVTQEVFMTVFQSIGGFKGEAKLATWLYRIAITKSLEWLRKKNRKKRFVLMQSLDNRKEDEPAWEIPHFYHPGIQLENKERAAILFAAIAQLPEQQKTAFLLFQSEHLSQADVAAAMDTTVSSVESLLFRAKKKLRTLLAHYYDTHNP